MYITRRQCGCMLLRKQRKHRYGFQHYDQVKRELKESEQQREAEQAEHVSQCSRLRPAAVLNTSTSPFVWKGPYSRGIAGQACEREGEARRIKGCPL